MQFTEYVCRSNESKRQYLPYDVVDAARGRVWKSFESYEEVAKKIVYIAKSIAKKACSAQKRKKLQQQQEQCGLHSAKRKHKQS